MGVCGGRYVWEDNTLGVIARALARGNLLRRESVRCPRRYAPRHDENETIRTIKTIKMVATNIGRNHVIASECVIARASARGNLIAEKAIVSAYLWGYSQQLFVHYFLLKIVAFQNLFLLHYLFFLNLLDRKVLIYSN